MTEIVALADRLARLRQYGVLDRPSAAVGRLTRLVGLTLEAVGLKVSMGKQCRVMLGEGRFIDAEVVGFHHEVTYLMPVQRVEALPPGAPVIPLSETDQLKLGPALIGRVINGIGQPLDSGPPLKGGEPVSWEGSPINPLHRRPVREALDVGIRAINGLLTVGEGQRIGLFAGSGVGKSVLLGMMTRFTQADVVVVGLIGERGREVREFVDDILGSEGLKRSIVVASPADDAPLMRLRAAQLCTRIAEFFRDRGQRVLLLMDSLTRFGQAQREIALAIGEPPATKGYPPSVFAKIPELVERAGNGSKGSGSVTAFYTVLTEGDDLQDPIADSARAILDGHVVLSREIAEQGIYPAIDVEASISRVMPNIVDEKQLVQAQRFKRLRSCYRQNQDLINIGAYTAGSDPQIDDAIARKDKLETYVSQSMKEGCSFAHARTMLEQLLQ